jgi:hypothetical protein
MRWLQVVLILLVRECSNSNLPGVSPHFNENICLEKALEI